MNNGNGFSKTVERIKLYCSKNKKQFHLQLIVTAAISIILIGQLGASKDYIAGVTDHITKNPFLIIWYAFTLFPLTFGIFLLLNIAILVLLTNMKNNLYDSERNFQISEKGTMGTGGFMKAEDKEKALYMDTVENTDGMILGKDPDTGLILSPRESLYLNGHKYVCGGSGARKTTTQVMNDLYQYLKANDSFIVTDPKGEIYGMLAAMCKKRGYNVKVLNLVNFINSDAIDFVKCCRDDNGNQDIEVKNVMTLVAVIMANTSDEKEAGFWKNQQTALLTAAILYVMYDRSGLTEPTLGGAYNFIVNNDLSDLERKFRNLDPTHPARIQISKFLGAKEEIQSSAVTGLIQRLQILQLNAVQQIISRDEIDLVEPGKSRCAYFIIMSDQERTFDFISSLFFSMFFIKIVAYADSTHERKTKIPVHLVMDEFPSIGTIIDLSRKFATLRSRQILITIIFQNIGQVMDKYEQHEWQTILFNCDIGVYLGGNDSEETARFFLNRIGEMTAVTVGIRKEENIFSPTGNRFYPTSTVTESETRRPVMTIDEFLRLPLDVAIVLIKSNRPLKVLKFVHTEHPYSKEIVELNAIYHIPVWRRENEGFPLEFTDSELAPVIQEMCATKQMAQYLMDRKADHTYNFMTYLAENRPDIFPAYRDIYMERIRQEQEFTYADSAYGRGDAENPEYGSMQENRNAESFTTGSTAPGTPTYGSDQENGSLGTNGPAASFTTANAARTTGTAGAGASAIAGGSMNSASSAAPYAAPPTQNPAAVPGASGNRNQTPPLPYMPPLANRQSSDPSTPSEAYGAVNAGNRPRAAYTGTSPSGNPRVGNQNAGNPNTGNGISGKASPATSQQAGHINTPAAGVMNTANGPTPVGSVPVSQNANPGRLAGTANQAAGVSGNGTFSSGPETSARSFSAPSAAGNPYSGYPGAGDGTSSPRRSLRPKRTFKKVDLKAEIEEAQEAQEAKKKQRKQSEGNHKAEETGQTVNPAANASFDPTAETAAQTSEGVSLSGSEGEGAVPEKAGTIAEAGTNVTSKAAADTNTGIDHSAPPSDPAHADPANEPCAPVSDMPVFPGTSSDLPGQMEASDRTDPTARTETEMIRASTHPGDENSSINVNATSTHGECVSTQEGAESMDGASDDISHTPGGGPAPANPSVSPSSAGKPFPAHADRFKPSGQGTAPSGDGNRSTSSETDPCKAGTDLPPLMNTNFRVFDIHAVSFPSSPEKTLGAGSPIIHHEIGIKRKGDSKKKGLKKVNPSES